MSQRVGIERINLYGGSMSLDLRTLAEARDKDPDKNVSELLINRRTLLPPWEDIITIAANAAKPIIDEEIAEKIGLFIVGTEGSTDFGKPISTNLHEALQLPSNVRNFETKHACFSGMAAMDSAIDWVASGHNQGRKALVIAADFSRVHMNTKQEFVMGGVATAMVISDQPEIIEFELGKRGNWTTNIYDTYRPTAREEMGNNETSLFTYIDALEGSYNDYVKIVEGMGEQIDFNTYFKKLVFHTPFAGMAFQAFRSLNSIANSGKKKSELRTDFETKVLPALRISRQVGSCYASSNYAGIVSLLLSCDDLQAGDRVGFYAYGSGAIGEFYSATVCPDAGEKLQKLQIIEKLEARYQANVSEYEENEAIRDSYVENPDFEPDFSKPAGVYDKCYKDAGLYVLKSVREYRRKYGWS
ncbi:hydroxymethylglutaryl-CoA synthase [Candidatus Haliotispira prima]|uniref:Hydroxymethylglutaryl-CoA synthase n=1 Tax=Candidatus Haliotispira prima TaxID=3034016 RepID=A0ABY8MDV4_9SPIO|nr:hydroxymethylglutaryl-CoA synthase [Candidatus Haliotispira prima]